MKSFLLVVTAVKVPTDCYSNSVPTLGHTLTLTAGVRAGGKRSLESGRMAYSAW